MLYVEIYIKVFCFYCSCVLVLLCDKGVIFDEYDVMMGGLLKVEMVQCFGGWQIMLQVFIGDIYVGGSDDLMVVECLGEFDWFLVV